MLQISKSKHLPVSRHFFHIQILTLRMRVNNKLKFYT